MSYTMHNNIYLFTWLFFFNTIFFHTHCINVEDTELVMTFLVHRHGDRTPLQKQVHLSNDRSSLSKLSEEYGYGQLTNEGKRCSYNIGQFIRRRYNALLSPRYNSSEVYIRSTMTTRTMMTTLVAMAAVYSAEDDRWSSTINWTPVPYATVPTKYDHNTALMSCPKFKKAMEKLFTSNIEALSDYKGILEKISEEVGYNITEMPLQLYPAYDVYLSQLSLGLPLSPKLLELMPEIKKGAHAAFDFILGNDENLIIQAGVLLNEFFKTASTVISGEETRRVWILSAHDLNVYALMGVSKTQPKPELIKYGGIFALELRIDLETGIYYVLPVYVSSPKLPEKYLRIDGCGDVLCDYDRFQGITSKYAVRYDAWRTKCEIPDDKDMPFDDEYMNVE